jgi:ubiquinone/menaquinone biosynthesis C-methylase UbiE
MSDSGQVTRNAAEVYDELFPAALFDQWAPRVAEFAELQAGMSVLDVACGTGVLSLVAADIVGPTGSVVGLDLNAGMLEVAKRKAAHIDWHEAPAEAIPFGNSKFDAVVSQFGLMFFQDKVLAIREMMRVLRPGGKLAIAVWDSLANVTGYAGITRLLSRLFGDSCADSLRAPYALGDTQELSALFSDAGVPDIEIETVEGKACFPSIRYWMEADIRGWTLADALDDKQFELLVSEAESELSPFVTAEGAVTFSSPAHIVLATKHAA